jgi:hypothetical protein
MRQGSFWAAGWILFLGIFGFLATPLSADEALASLMPSQPIRPAIQIPFAGGENFKFVIRWGAVTGGYSTLTVQEPDSIAGKKALHLVSEAHSTGLVNKIYPVNDRNEAWLDTDGFSSLRYEKHIREGNYHVHEIVVLDQVLHKFFRNEWREGRAQPEWSEGAIPPNVLDIYGSLYYVRCLPLEVGKSFTMDVQSGEKVWPLVVQVKKRQTVKVKAGKFDCFLVEPILRQPGIFISKGKKMEVWLTADERHIPVLMRAEVFIGHVSAELVSMPGSSLSSRIAALIEPLKN